MFGPNGRRGAAHDVEDAAADGVVGRTRRRGADEKRAVGALAMQAAGGLHHRLGDVAADIAPAMAGFAQERQEIAIAAADVQHAGLGIVGQ